MAAHDQTAGERQRGMRFSAIGGLVLAALDVTVYLILTLTEQPAGCSAPPVTTTVLDCFWTNLGASLFHQHLAYASISLAASFAVGLLVATRGGGSERRACVVPDERSHT